MPFFICCIARLCALCSLLLLLYSSAHFFLFLIISRRKGELVVLLLIVFYVSYFCACFVMSSSRRLLVCDLWLQHIPVISQLFFGSNFTIIQRQKSKRLWSGNTTITHCRPTHDTVRKSHKTFTVTIHPKDNNSKATISLFQVTN